MQKIVAETPGGPEALVLRPFELPQLQPGHVEVKIVAIPVNRVDLAQRSGQYMNLPFPMTPGIELCGEIVKVGSEVSNRFLNEKVYYLGAAQQNDFNFGTYASHIQMPIESVHIVPEECDLIQLASAGAAALLALETFQSFSKNHKRILITGASGGIGSTLIMMGKFLGFEILASTTTKEKVTYCSDLGASEVLNLRDGSLPDLMGESSVDGVIELLGYRTFEQCLELLKPGGLLVSLGSVTGHDIQLDLSTLEKGVSIMGLNLKNLAGEKLSQLIARLCRILSSQKLPDFVHKKYDLADAALVHSLLETRQVKGRALLLP